jgi:hypothetical protein
MRSTGLHGFRISTEVYVGRCSTGVHGYRRVTGVQVYHRDTVVEFGVGVQE